MSKKYFLLLLFAVLLGSVAAQNSVLLKKLNATKPIAIQMPIMMDSTNLKGDKFEMKELLATSIQLPQQHEYTEMMDALDSVVMLGEAKYNCQVQFLSFSVSSDRYSKTNIKITSPNMFELYVDGKKESTKSTTEKNVGDAKDLKKEIVTLPNQSREVTIKYICTSDKAIDNGIKIEVTADKEANLLTSYNGKRYTKVQDGMEGTRVSYTRISPNGQFILTTFRSVDSEGKVTMHTELLDTKSHKNINLGSQTATWMPQSNKFYYTKKLVDALQLITVDPETMSEQVIAKNIPAGGFSFAPNEKYLIFHDKDKNDERKGDFKLVLAPDDRQDNYMERYYVTKFDLSTGINQRLTFGKNSTSVSDISPDSRYLLLSTSQEDITEHPFRQSSLYMLDIETMKMDTIWENQKFVGGGRFSPDMKYILSVGSAEAFDAIGQEINEGQIANSYNRIAFLYEIGTKNVTPLSKGFNPSVNNAAWNNYDNLIYLTTVDKDCENVYTYNPKSKAYTKLNFPEDVASSFSISRNSNMASFLGRSISNPTRLYSYDLKSKKATLLSDPMKPVMDNLTLGEVKDWSFTASDGTTIEGFYHLPPNFDSSKKYPMIVYYYGGTSPTSRTFEHPYSMHNFAALGYVVYTLNPSGTTGYGQEFAARHVNSWGIRTAEDIIEGTKEFVKEHTFVNADKIGCVGASYGGFMTMYLQTQTDIFAAAISHAGISSLSSYWGEGYWGYSYSAGASAHSYPWNNKDLYINQSPLFQADKIKTPILFTHGTQDTNVPIGESIQMYTALKILGVPTEFLQVKDENHGIMKHDRRIQWSYHMYAWFDKWLKDQPQWWASLYPLKEKKEK